MIELTKTRTLNHKTINTLYLKVLIILLIMISAVSTSFANNKNIVPILSLLLDRQSGKIQSHIDLGARGYKVNYGNLLLDINNNRFHIPPNAEEELPILLTPDNELAGYGRLISGQYLISPKTTAFYFFDKIVPHISQLNTDQKTSLYKLMSDLQSFSQLEMSIKNQEYSPLVDHYTALMSLVAAVIDELQSVPAQKQINTTFEDSFIKKTLKATYQDSPFINGISLQDLDINYISDDEINVKVNVRSKNLSYMVAQKIDYNFQTNEYGLGLFEAYIDPQSASNLLSSFTSVSEIQQNISDMTSLYHNVLDYGVIGGSANSAAPGDSSTILDLKMSCQYNAIRIEGDTLESLLYSNVQILINALDMLSKMEKLVSKMGNNSIVKQVLGNNNITTISISSDQFQKFEKEFAKRLVIELIKNAEFRQTLVSFVTSGDYHGLAEKLFSIETVHEIFKAVAKVTINLITDNKFGLLPKDEISDILLGSMDVQLRLYFGNPEDLIEWPTEAELIEKLLLDPEMQDVLLKKGSGLFFKMTGLEAYKTMVSLTTTLSDTWMLAFGISNPPNDFIYIFSDYFPECGETSINLSSILPKQATVGKETTFVLSGTLLSRVSTVNIANCTNQKLLLAENERIAVECTPTAEGNQSIYYGVTGSNEVFTSPVKALIVSSIKEPIIDSIAGSIAQTGVNHLFAIHGVNLENIVNLYIQDCANSTIISNSTNLLRAECDQFNSSGYKNISIEYRTSSGYTSKDLMAFQVFETEMKITDYTPQHISTATSVGCLSFGDDPSTIFDIRSQISISGFNLNSTYMMCVSNYNNLGDIDYCSYNQYGGNPILSIYGPMYLQPDGSANLNFSHYGSGTKRVYFYDLQERNIVHSGGQANIANSLDYIDVFFEAIPFHYGDACPF